MNPGLVKNEMKRLMNIPPFLYSFWSFHLKLFLFEKGDDRLPGDQKTQRIYLTISSFHTPHQIPFDIDHPKGFGVH
jgi:hypothetical protein